MSVENKQAQVVVGYVVACKDAYVLIADRRGATIEASVTIYSDGSREIGCQLISPEGTCRSLNRDSRLHSEPKPCSHLVLQTFKRQS